jgi:peptidase M28-like protein
MIRIRMRRHFAAAGIFAAGLTAIVAGAQSADLASEGAAWWAHIKFLADDSLEGRNVGTPGFDKALDYVEGQFKAIGLKPAGTSGYRQPLKLDSRTLVPEQSSLSLVRNGTEEPLAIGQDATLNARGELDGSTEAQMVFVGYGMSIPDAGWDDFAGQNLRGKIAVYVNAFPPAKVSDNVRSHVNTADQRWLELKRAGAIGVATIAPVAPGRGGAAGAGAGGAGRAGGGGTPAPVITLLDRTLVDAAGQIIAMSLSQSGAAKVLAGSGHTVDELNQLVADGKPLPRFPIAGTLKAHAKLNRQTIDTANVAGMVEGSDPKLKSEYVIMTAHLDHVGIGRAVNGDNIYNGAMDDASGVAAVIETARLLKSSGVKTKRSVVFVAVTAEEKGLLGSRYFAGHPTVPFESIVADINLDMFLPLYPLKVIEVQGLAESSLGESVREAAKTLGVDVQTDREPEQNRFIRSDQYSFIRRGVPALAFKFGYEFGSADETTRRNWVRDVYHQPNDDTKQPVDLEAAAKFNRVIMTLLQRVANDTARPTWNTDSFFKRFATGR